MNKTFFLLLLLLPPSLSGQNSPHSTNAIKQDTHVPENKTEKDQFSEFFEEYKQLIRASPAEKVYLHIDRPGYMPGDTIWFKAYTWIGHEQVPDTFSSVLYVDLLSPEGKPEHKRKLLIINGTSNGDFCLDKSIKPGRYTLCAYTRWMQNPNTGDPFYQTIIINPSNQDFQVECEPVILKQPGNDSLQVKFRFFEMDPGGELKNYFNHKVTYSLKLGEQILHTGNVIAVNTKEQVFRSRLPWINEKDTTAILVLSIRDENLTFEKQFRIPINEPVDLQFFPEGGKLVNDLESKVAFKAIGTDGRGREVKGEIRDGRGELVTNFVSSHKGMGAFLLTPVVEKEYFAHLRYNDRKYICPLPSALKEGCVISLIYSPKGDDPNLIIKYKPSEPDTQKYIIATSYGKIRFVSPVKTTNDSSVLQIPLNLFPEGVARISLLNGKFKPECERLIYIYKNQKFTIRVEPDSSSYGTRSKVKLLIKATGSFGMPLQTDLSLAVVDKEQIIKEVSTRGITAYKLLESELRGYIEDVDFYFKNDNSANSCALDLLLLTQGYRKFDNGNLLAYQQKFLPERSIDISGKIQLLGLQARNKKFNYRDIGLTLLCPSESPYIDLSSPDSLGHFNFNIPLLNGKPLSLLQALNRRGKPVYGDIIMDEPDTFPQLTPPLTIPVNIKPPALEYINSLQAVKKTEISKIASGIGMYLDMPEVTIKARDKNYFLNFEKDALKIANLDSLDPDGNKFESIYDLLVREFNAQWYRIPGMKTVFLPSRGMLIDYYYPIYLINGQTYFTAGEDSAKFAAMLNNLSVMNVNEIKRLMVLPPGRIATWYADPKVRFYPDNISQSLVVIETYSKHTYRGDPQGILTFILNGLDTPGKFYSPRYEGPSRDSPLYDGRATIYWNPTIKTDSNGQAKVEFYTSDRQTELEVIVNGIEIRSGNTGQARTLINSSKTQ